MSKTERASLEDDIILVIIVLISILITELISCFLPTSPKPSVTSPSKTKKLTSSTVTSQKRTRSVKSSSETLKRTRRQATSSKTSEASSNATGSLPVVITPTKTSQRLQGGTKSQPTETSRNGVSIAVAQHQLETKSSPITPTRGLGFSA